MSQVLRETLFAGGVFGASIALAFVARLLLSRVAQRFDRSEDVLADDLLRAARLPAVLVILLAGLYVALRQPAATADVVEKYSAVFRAATVLIILIGATSATNLALMWYSKRLSGEPGVPSHLGLMRKLLMLAVWTLGILQILTVLGVKITTALASLGIAGLAVGLALQDTIANLFAGFYLVADRSVRAGDYIKLDSGEEGFVEVVGWRNTRIRLWANNMVLVPNAKLVQSTIINMALPGPSLSIYTYCGVSYESDLDRVEEVCLEVARQVLNSVPGADLSFDPVLRFKEFADSNINFVVVFRATEVGAQYLLQHEYIKALHRRFREERIDISYPIRKLVWDGAVSLPVHTASARTQSSPEGSGGRVSPGERGINS